MHPKDADGMANSVDSDQTALFAETYLSQYIEFVRYHLMIKQDVGRESSKNTTIIISLFSEEINIKYRQILI